MIPQKDKVFIYFDRVILSCLCLLILFLPFKKAGVEIFAWSAFFLWLLKKILEYIIGARRPILLKTELNKPLGVFIAINLLSLVFSVNHGLSLRGFFGKELKFMAIYFMLVETINSKERLKVVLVTIIASALLILADAWAQYFMGVDFINHIPLARLTASFLNPNGFAGWLIVMIPLFCGLLGTGKFLGKTGKGVLFILIMMLSVCLLLTYTRGAWLGLAVGILLMAYYAVKLFSLKIKILSLSLCVILCLSALFLPQPIKDKVKAIGRINFKWSQTLNERIKSVTKVGEGSALIRINLWKESLRIIRDYPLTGCGLNTYTSVVPKYKISESGGMYSHNSFLQMAAETGLLGLFAFLVVLFVFFKTGFRYLDQKRNPLVFGLLAGILAFLVHGFFDNHLYALQLVVLFWFMLGLTVAVIKLDSVI